VTRGNAVKDRERLLKELIRYFKQERVPYTEFLEYLEEVYTAKLVEKSEEIFEKPEGIRIPVSVFDNGYLSALETIVKYLYENKGLKLVEIARLLNRDPRAVGVTYRFARRKMKSVLRAPVTKYSLPLSVVAEKRLSVLESVVYYLRITYNLSYHEVAVLLRRDDRTVWTVYHRALKKLRKA